jgi:hypothetical protein
LKKLQLKETEYLMFLAAFYKSTMKKFMTYSTPLHLKA